MDRTKILVAHLSKGLQRHQWQDWSSEIQMPSGAYHLDRQFGAGIAQAPCFRARFQGPRLQGKGVNLAVKLTPQALEWAENCIFHDTSPVSTKGSTTLGQTLPSTLQGNEGWSWK